MAGFEGSFMGDAGRISDRAVMECKICWTAYDPGLGDPSRQVPAGTAFADLPADWSCPTCSSPRAQFMVLRDPDAPGVADTAMRAARVRALEAEFTEIWHAKMRDVPVVNRALRVQAVGFRDWGEGWLGVLVAPWFMNLVLLPRGAEDWRGLTAGAKEDIEFPSGTYEFLHNVRGALGGYKACSLFSPMDQFQSHAQAVEVAEAVMTALFDDANRAETDRAGEIRARREADLAAAAEAEDTAPPPAVAPSRRAVLSGRLSEGEVERDA